jgi:glycosyltransferase involved in cell wall biosynthesis
MPKISVITPLYNKAEYILETIESVRSQIFSDWEMLIVDNGSTDDSLALARQIKDERIKILQCQKKGPGAARNYGLNSATGEWIQFLDADDLLLPNHFQQQLEVAQKNTNADLIVCCWEEFKDTNLQPRILKKPTGIGKSSELLKNTAIAFTPWPPHTALVKRDILQGEFLWAEELDQFLAEDTPFWFRLISNYQVAYNERVGVLYRAQVPQSRTNLNSEKWFEGLHQAVKNNLNYIQNKYVVNAHQCESLVRLYSGIYLLASQQKSRSIQNKSIREANFWLQTYFQHNNRPKLSLIIRRLLGMKIFLQLKHFSTIN